MTDARRALFLTMLVFALQPMAFGGWLALIPAVKAGLGLDKSTLALCLLGLPVASVPMLQVASRAVAGFGPRRVLMAGLPVQAVVFVLPVLATGPATLFAALAVNGAVMAFMQASLNVYAGRLEKSMDVVVMGRCHGAWALGLMAGSLAVTVLLLVRVPIDLMGAGLLAGLDPWVVVLLVSVPTSLAGVMVARALPRLVGGEGGAVPPRRRLREVPVAVYYISIFALAVAMTEGAMSDWAAVYLAERLPPGASHAGIAVSIYAGFLAAGRFAGDVLKVRMGAVGLARGSIALAIVGVLALVMPLPIGFAYLGFALIGLGASVGFPLGVSAVAALDDTYEAANIALMSMLAIAGFLLGPPLIGFLADAFGLRVGLSALLPLLGVSLVLAGWLAPRLRS